MTAAQIERWRKFSKGQQLGAIAAEISRAKTWQNQDREKSLMAIERALELIDCSLDDSRWSGWRSMLYWLRNELAKFYLGRKEITIDLLKMA